MDDPSMKEALAFQALLDLCSTLWLIARFKVTGNLLSASVIFSRPVLGLETVLAMGPWN